VKKGLALFFGFDRWNWFSDLFGQLACNWIPVSIRFLPQIQHSFGSFKLDQIIRIFQSTSIGPMIILKCDRIVWETIHILESRFHNSTTKTTHSTSIPISIPIFQTSISSLSPLFIFFFLFNKSFFFSLSIPSCLFHANLCIVISRC